MAVAGELGGTIVSVDSMQVYREMDIGTAKPSLADRTAVPHHMIDVADPEELYSVARFQSAGRAAIAAASTPVIIAGGSGLHFRSLVDPLDFPPTDAQLRERLEALEPADVRRRLLALDPEAPDHVDMDNPRRVVRAVEVAELTGATPSVRSQIPQAAQLRAYEPLMEFQAFGVDPGDDLETNVNGRLTQMRSDGLLAEVAALADRLGPTAANAVGYKQLLGVVRGEVDENEGFEAAARATLSLAKRQRTFFRRDPRIEWISDADDPLTTIMEAIA